MRPEDDTDPTPSSSPNSTDPIFPPKLGKAGPRAVSVTAVQGPGPEGSQEAKEITTTERLLTGLLDAPPEVKKKQENKQRKKESSGETAADYSVSPRSVPAAHEIEDEPAVIVAPPSNPRRLGTLDGEKKAVEKGTRQERTVPLPRKDDRAKAIAVFVAALLVVSVAGLWITRASTPPAPPATTITVSPTAVAPTTPSDSIPAPMATDEPNVQSDPVIESQQIRRPRFSSPPPRNVANAPSATPAPSAGASAPAATTTTTTTPNRPALSGTALPPDFDELKKGIKH